MLGIGGALQSQFQHRPPADKHKRNVHRILSLDPSESEEGGDADDGEPSRKKRKKEDEKKEGKKEQFSIHSAVDTTPRPLHEVIIEAKEKMNGPDKRNGLTFALMGASGCGKSTVIRKVFIEMVFGKQAAKERGEQEYIIQIFTESAKSDAFKDLGKDILVDPKGLDEDNINFCYHMNENYQKKYNFFIMLDDVLDIRHKDLLQRMFLTMRNTNISSLVSLQYPKLIPLSIRTSVYFTFFFHFPNEEAIEIVCRAWLGRYLPGRYMRDKAITYNEWTSRNDGHNFWMLDNLNHKCYKVDTPNEEYTAIEVPLLTSLPNFGEDITPGQPTEDYTSAPGQGNEINTLPS